LQIGPEISHSDADNDPHSAARPLAADLCKRAILLDIDGTILDLAPSPGQVRVPTSLRAVLARLSELSGGALALVSGRSIADIDLIFSPLRLPAIGVHGAELRASVNAKTEVRVAPLSETLKRKLASVGRLADGILVEDKGYSLALHYRLAPEKGPAVAAAVAEICSRSPQQAVEILNGKSVVEVKPSGINKGDAVAALLRRAPFAGRQPIYIGDDTTDLPVFAVIRKLGGRAYSVGEIAAEVDGNFDRPESVRLWLEHLAAVGGGSAQ
jgi:trehalose 6-phosphate phosphatase